MHMNIPNNLTTNEFEKTIVSKFFHKAVLKICMKKSVELKVANQTHKKGKYKEGKW